MLRRVRFGADSSGAASTHRFMTRTIDLRIVLRPKKMSNTNLYALDVLTKGLESSLYCATLVIIAIGVSKALLSLMNCSSRRKNADELRIELGHMLTMALTVLIAAEIVRMLNIQTWQQLGRAAAVMLIRHLLKRSLDDDDMRKHESKEHVVPCSECALACCSVGSEDHSRGAGCRVSNAYAA